MAAPAMREASQSRSAYFPVAAEVEASTSAPVCTAPRPEQDHNVVAPALQSRAPSCRSFSTASQHTANRVSSSALRAWRFPSSRRYLWDRTATGPCVHLHPQVSGHINILAVEFDSLVPAKLIFSVQAFLPTVVLRQQVFTCVQEQTGATKQLHVPAAWLVGVNNAISLAIGAGASCSCVTQSIICSCFDSRLC